MHAQSTKPVILVLSSTYPRWSGDPEPGFVHELARRLTGRFRVLVLCPHSPNSRSHEMLDGVEVIRYHYAPQRWETLVNDGGIVTNLKRNRWKKLLVPVFILMQAWKAFWLCRQEKVDVIHAHWLLPQGLIAALLQCLFGRKVPFIVTSHGADLYALRSKPLMALKRWVFQRAKAATVVSRAMLDELACIGADTQKVSVQPMGVDMSQHFIPDPGVTRSHNEILFVGRLVEKKGLRYLIDALPAVRQRVPDAYLTVVGFGPDTESLKAQVRSLGLEDSVHFEGAVSQARLPDYYRRAALFVAPFVQATSGDQEGLGLVAVEAIGCECPVLVGQVPAAKDVFGDEGFNFWSVDSRSKAALACRIVEVLINPSSTKQRVLQLRNEIKEKFDWTGVVDRYEGLLLEVAMEKGACDAAE